MTAALLALAVLGGVPWPVVTLLAVGALRPAIGIVVVVAAVAAFSLRQRRLGGPHREAVYLAAVAAELRRGASLRAALAHAAAGVPDLDLGAVERMAVAGAPMPGIARTLRTQLPVTAKLVVPAVQLAAESGGRAAQMFDRLALRAVDQADARRQFRAASAQARLSAWVVGSLPVLALGFGWWSGRLQLLIAAGPVGVAAVTVGVLLLGLGVGSVAVLSGGASR